MSRELFSQVIGPLNKGVNQQANSFVLPGFAKSLENANCDLVEGLKKRLGSVPLKRIDTLTKYDGHGTPGNNLSGTIKWDEAWYFIYNRSTDERFVLVIADDSSTVSKTVTTNSSAVVTITSGGITDLFVGAVVSGSGIPTGSKIVEIGATTFTLDKDTTASASGVTVTVESSKTFVAGVSDIEPLSGSLPTIVPVEQIFSNITTANLEYFRGSGRARDRFRATSFQDYVFVTNTQKEVSYDSAETLTRYNVGYIGSSYVPIKAQLWVKLVDYNTKYEVTIELDDGTSISANITTATLSSGTAVSTQTIATDLKNALDTADTGNELTFTVNDSQVLIGLTDAARSVKSFVAADARGNTLMSGFADQVTSIIELPSTSWEGYTIVVSPDGTADQGSYYLKFNAENVTVDGTFGRGSWEEVGGWGVKGKLDKATMPHVFLYYRNASGLVRFTVSSLTGATYTDGAFTHDFPKWTERLSGDNGPDGESDTGPSFATKKISDVVFFKNRLGFISGENVILSEAGAYFNFWQQSALQVIDSDPIDLTAVSNDVAVLNYALQQQDELVLFSNENQFRLYSGDNVTFSPETASIGRISSISMEANVKPQQVGPQVIFPVKEGDFTGLHTFITTDRTVGINLGQTAVITETVPKYIPKNIDSLAVSRTDQYLVALSKDDPDALYVYQFFWEASGGSLTNRQNAWSKWTFPNKSLYWCDFVEGTLYSVAKYTEDGTVKYYLEGLNASRPPQESKDLFLLDRQLASTVETDVRISAGNVVTFAYSGATNKTTVTLPYYTVNQSQFIVIKKDKTDANEAEKRWIVAATVPAGVNSFVLDSLGDFSGCSWIFGEVVTFKFTPPHIMPYSKTATDNTFIGNRTGRLQLRYVDVYYNDARYFKIDVTPKFRTTSTYEFDRRDPLNANIIVGQVSDFEEAKFRAYVQSKNDQVTVEVVNDSIDQAKFVALEWTGLYFDVARKYS
tara:strand:- start:10776 stop:13682 length:2907 start_codon:yes stop_codon:yes gene_type:complete